MSDALFPENPALTVTISDSGRDPFDLLAEEFAERCRNGESPSISDYAVRHPEYAEKIRRLLPTVAMMEQLKRRAEHAKEGEPARSVPERLGDFQIVRELGRGGMGVVYEAFQESLGRLVALKVIHNVHPDLKRLQRFQRETLAVAQLHHTNIVPIFGIGEHEGLPYYAMQYIRGSGLDALVATWRSVGPPPGQERWRFVARVGLQAAEALQYAHDQGILHRDIKPANLLLDEQQAVWLTDFGLAKLTGQDDLTASGDVIGTLRYLAPEALSGESDGRSDVYSLGLTLYEMITLSPPFGELSPSELLHQVSAGQPTRPRKLDPSISRDLETIILTAIAREPGHRYQTARALADDLNLFLEDRPIRARRATLFEQLWRWSRRNPTMAALTATVALSLCLAVVIGWFGFMGTMLALERESRLRGEAEIASKRAEKNVALSLEVFEELFDRLAAHDNLQPPPLGLSGHDRPADHIPRADLGLPRTGPPGRRPPPSDQDDRAVPDRRPRGMPPWAHRHEISDRDTALLLSILTFYDRFARQNATNPKLQGEAAWAYRKIGVLDEKLGRDAESEKAFARAIELFEELVARLPNVPEYRYKLVDTYDMADPWSANPASLERLEQDIRRAQTLIDQLVTEAPENIEYAQAQVHIHAKLGVACQRLKRTDEAEACYRRAIDLEGAQIQRWPRNARFQIDRAITRQALAMLQLERGRRDEARTLLDEAATDFKNVAVGPPPADRIESLATAYKKLGATERAEELSRWAVEIDARPRPEPPDPFDRGPGAPRPNDDPP